MSGHSKWATIKHKKGAADKARGKLFAKLIRQIEVAARNGGGDPDMNPTLRTMFQKARDASVPRDTIEKAIKRGTGELEGVNYEEVTYEGYGPGGVAVLVEAVTDNRNRTVADLRNVFDKCGGNLGTSGSVAWMFTKRGLLAVDRAGIDEDRVMEVALEAGADDVTDSGDILEVLTAPEQFEAVKEAMEAAGVTAASAEITMMPSSTTSISGKPAEQMVRLLEMLDDHEDVQRVSSNMDIAAEELERLSA
jgi:YebC/PmpR family DNA-binding regulatory protein